MGRRQDTFRITRDEGGMGVETIAEGLTDQAGAWQLFDFHTKRGHVHESVWRLKRSDGYTLATRYTEPNPSGMEDK